MTLHHLTGIQASTSICGSTCEQLIPFSIWSVALLGSCWWAQSSDSCCVESRCCCCFTRNVPSWLNFTSLLTRTWVDCYFHRGLAISYRACRAGPWLSWCVRTHLLVCGSPIPRPVGRTAAPSVLLPSAGRSCPTRRGTWLHGEEKRRLKKIHQNCKMLIFWRNHIWISEERKNLNVCAL